MKYKITNAIKTGEFDSKFGKMFKYTVQLEGETEAVEVVQKPDSPVPSGEIEGNIENTQYGRKFKKDRPAFNGAKTSPRDPETQRYIMRQNALTATIARGVCKVQELCKYAKDAKEVNKILDDELGGKHIVQVASMLAKYSEGRITVVMTPEQVAKVMGYEPEQPQEDKYTNEGQPPKGDDPDEVTDQDIEDLPFS